MPCAPAERHTASRECSLSASSEKPIAPGLGHEWRIDLYRQVVLERLWSVVANPIHHREKNVSRGYLVLVAEKSSRFVRRTERASHFLRTVRHVDRMQIER